MRENLTLLPANNRRTDQSCASVHSDQSLCCSLPGICNTTTYGTQIFNILARLCSRGSWFESQLVETPKRQIFRDSKMNAPFSFKVIWMNPRKTLISTDDSRYIDDSRLSVERPKIEDWNLMIREVRYNDSGEYMCQVNTKPVMIKRIYLFVKG